MLSIFRKKKDAISVFVKDQLGSVYGVVHIPRASVMDAIYVTTKGVLQLVLSTSTLQGRTDLEWKPLQKAKLTNGQITDIENTGGIRQEKMFSLSQVPNTVEFSEEDEIRKIWNWLDNGIDADVLFEKRAESIKTLAEFKEKKKKEQMANEEKEKNKEKPEGEASPDAIMKAGENHADEEAMIDMLKKGELGQKQNSPMKKVED